MQYQESFPDETWTLEQLATYCKNKLRRWAKEAWLMGQAFTLAKAKTGQGKWGEWQKDNNFNPAMTERYRKLFRGTTLEELEGLTLTEACRKFGININGRKKKSVYVEKLDWEKPVAGYVPAEPESLDFDGMEAELPGIEANGQRPILAARPETARPNLRATEIPPALQLVKKMLSQAFIHPAEDRHALPAGRHAEVRDRAQRVIDALDDLLAALLDDGAELALAA